MKSLTLLTSMAALIVLAACQPMSPNDAFNNSNDRFEDARRAQAARDAALSTSRQSLPAPVGVETQELQPTVTEIPLDQTGTETAATASPTAPTAVRSGAISDENDFEAVSGRETIESDAARLERNRAQYVVITPTSLPSRAGNVPNIVKYAIQTNNPVGVALYKRNGFSTQNRHLRNCQKFASQDLAQQDFLARGGPIRDRQGLDPDGDGFACRWDPRPFRASVSN